MSTQIKILVLLFFVLFIHLPSSRVEGFKHGLKVTYPVKENPMPEKKTIIKLMKTRKLMEVGIVLDYDYGGPNTKHDPKKGKPGNGGSKNP